MTRKELKTAAIWLISVVTAFFSGGGAYWKYLESHRETQKLTLDSVQTTINLRQQQLEFFKEAADLTTKFDDVQAQYNKDVLSHNPAKSEEIRHLTLSMNQISSQLKVLRDNILTIEEQLAKIEGREPRKIDVQFHAPGPPAGLKAKPIYGMPSQPQSNAPTVKVK